MDREYSSDCVATTLHNLCRYWEERQKSREGPFDSASPHPFTIAISREAGTQGAAVGREVGARLGWQVYDHELLERIAQDLGVRTILLDRVDERRKSWLKESFESLFGVPFVSEATYVHRLIKTILGLATHGECVIVGRGAPFILPAATTLRIRLIGPLIDRVGALTRELGITRDEANRQLQGIDRMRIKFVRDHFHKDAADPSHYDAVLCVASYGIEGCADLIVDALKRRQSRLANAHQSEQKSIRRRGTLALTL